MKNAGVRVDWAQLERPVYQYRPLPSQKRFLLSPARIRMLLGGNGSGKSKTGAYAIARATLLKPPPRRNCPAWIIGKSYEMVCGTCWAEKLQEFIQPQDIAWTSYLVKQRDWPAAIGLKSGWTIEFKSSDQGRKAFQSRSIGLAWFDEQFPEDVFHETFARTRDYNAPIIGTLTPIEPDPFLQAKYDDPTNDWSFTSLDLEENRRSRGGYISDDWIDAFIANTPEDFRDVRIRGKFAGFEGAVFKIWRRDLHIVDPFPNNIPPEEGIIVRGIDFGFGNPFCCLWIHCSRDGIWTVYDEHYEARKFIEYHADAIKSRPEPRQHILRTWSDPEDLEARVKLDELGVENSIANKAINQSCECIMKLLMPMENGQPRLRVTKNCKNLIREMPAYQWSKVTSAVHNAKNEPIDKDNHAIAALRYALYNEELGGGPMLMPSRIQPTGGGFSDGYSSVLGIQR